MYNIVFIDIDKLGDSVERPEILNQLAVLTNNIEKAGEYCTNHIYLVSRGNLEEKKFDMALLKSYFMAISQTRDDFGFLCCLCSDAYYNGYIERNDLKLEEKMAFVIANYPKESVDLVTHITGEVSDVVLNKSKDFRNIVLFEGFEKEESPANIFVLGENEQAYVTSEISGIKGFNDCFNSYFKAKKTRKLTKED